MIKYMGELPKLSYMILNKHLFEKFIRELLLIKQYRVDVYIRSTPGKNNDWKIEYKGSPGNLSQFEDILFDNCGTTVVNSCVMAVNPVKNKILAIATVNTVEFKFSLCEFTDNEFYTELETFIAQTNPKECLIPNGESPDLIALNTILTRNGIIVIKVKRTEFNSSDISQDLNRLLYFTEGQQRNCYTMTETTQLDAMGSLQAAIKYLNLTGDENNFNQFHIKTDDIHGHVRLDSAAISALHLFPPRGAARGRSSFKSVFEVLDSCVTSQGRRLMEQWIYQVVNSLPGMIKVLMNVDNKCINSILVNPLKDFYDDMEKYQCMLEEVLNMDLVNRGEFLVKPSFDKDLEELYNKKVAVEEKIQRAFKEAAHDLGVDPGKTIKLECTDRLGYFYKVTLKDEKMLRGKKKYQIMEAVRGGVRFNDKRLRELNEDYLDICTNYEELQKNVVKEVMDVAVGYADTLRSLNMSIAQVDVLTAFAHAATSAPIPFVKPNILPEGPNMGGKSTYMRSVALAVFLAHIGSFVPCDEAEISLVDCILTRVGASDCELKGLSTFMLEMVETSGIVRNATSNSLIIIDELGRGTSTYDGCSIAWAIAEYLVKELKSFSLFATHFHEITSIATKFPEVQNLHVSAVVTKDTLTPLYQIRKGPCDKSYGIHCARIAKFPADVLEEAEEHQRKLEFANGMKYINDFEFSLKRKAIDDGDELITNVLKKIQTIDETKMTDEEILSEMETLRNEQLSTGNLFLKGLLENPA
ncbi:dna mismatch repair protein muts family member [Holotrichia oblita]|uniref:Dna mismatch repair protein muts family member n=1 Tax=Holotrichia oblita TaxID=644536 RepID=A0ACB9SW79_HOLOL|nr:dna mismatch repair protein muts family member [Holotrichia oblita]